MSDQTRNHDKIEVGDTVRMILHFHDNADPEWLEGIVLHYPSDTGDSWRIRSGDNGLHYVQQFVIMTLIKKAE